MQVVAVTDPATLGFAIQAMVAISVTGDVRRVAAALEPLTEVEYVVITAGRFDLLVEVVCTDQSHLLDLVNDQTLYPLGTNQLFQPWAVERDLFQAALLRLFGHGPWLQLYLLLSLAVTMLRRTCCCSGGGPESRGRRRLRRHLLASALWRFGPGGDGLPAGRRSAGRRFPLAADCGIAGLAGTVAAGARRSAVAHASMSAVAGSRSPRSARVQASPSTGSGGRG
jgi:hypothetical protein